MYAQFLLGAVPGKQKCQKTSLPLSVCVFVCVYFAKL